MPRSLARIVGRGSRPCTPLLWPQGPRLHTLISGGFTQLHLCCSAHEASMCVTGLDRMSELPRNFGLEPLALAIICRTISLALAPPEC